MAPSISRSWAVSRSMRAMLLLSISSQIISRQTGDRGGLGSKNGEAPPVKKPAKGVPLPASKPSGVKVIRLAFAHWQLADLSAPAQFQIRPHLLPAKYGNRRQR